MKKRIERIRRVGLVMNTEKTNCLPLLEEAVHLLRAYQFDVGGDAATVETSGLAITAQGDTAALAAACDLLLVFGGDGTILRVAREVAGHCTPILGINVGRLGFLAEITAGQLSAAVDQIVAGDYRVESRPLMQAELKRGGAPLRAMNDFVFTRGDVSRMIEVEVAVDGEELTRYRCDGLIVASPTGSTAYSLAAGGAIVSPSARVFTITPICPLTLSNRSVIVDLNSQVLVRICTGKLKTHLTADGQVATRLRLGDETVIRKAPEEIRLLRLSGSSFFQTLRQKLHWSGSHA